MSSKLYKSSGRFKLIFGLIAIFLLTLFLMSIADHTWKKSAYKCIQSLCAIVAMYAIFYRPKFKAIILSVLTFNFFNLAYYSFIYGKVDAGVIYSLLHTNLNEASEFMHTADLASFLQASILSVIFLGFLILTYKGLDQIKAKRYKLLIPYFLGAILFIASGVMKSKEHEQDVFIKKVIKYMGQDIHSHFVSSFLEYQYLQSKYSLNMKSEWGEITHQQDIKKAVYMVFIGESARRDGFGLYREEFSTTPKLSSTDDITIVTDGISPAVQTRESLLRILALNTKNSIKYGLNIIDLAKKADFKTYWLSNQSLVGANDTSIASLGKRTHVYKFLNAGHYNKAGTDNLLLPEIERAILAESKKSKVIFVHTLGSHNAFCDRIWEKVVITNVAARDQCYYNSIHNGYALIGSVKKILQQQKLSFKMVYFSDHAMVKTDKSPYFVHGVGRKFNRSAVEVPLFFIYDEAVKEKVINKTYFLRDFPHTFADFIGVSAKQLDSTKSILNTRFKQQESFVVKSNLKAENL